MLPKCASNILNDKEPTRKKKKKCYSGAETPISGSVQAGVGTVGCPMEALAPELTNDLQGPL